MSHNVRTSDQQRFGCGTLLALSVISSQDGPWSNPRSKSRISAPRPFFSTMGKVREILSFKKRNTIFSPGDSSDGLNLACKTRCRNPYLATNRQQTNGTPRQPCRKLVHLLCDGVEAPGGVEPPTNGLENSGFQRPELAQGHAR